MVQGLLAATAHPAEAQRSRENGTASLAGLHSTSHEAPAVADALHMVQDRYLRVTSENEVAVHAVDGEIDGDSSHGGGKTLRDRSATVDSSGTWGMP